MKTRNMMAISLAAAAVTITMAPLAAQAASKDKDNGKDKTPAVVTPAKPATPAAPAARVDPFTAKVVPAPVPASSIAGVNIPNPNKPGAQQGTATPVGLAGLVAAGYDVKSSGNSSKDDKKDKDKKDKDPVCIPVPVPCASPSKPVRIIVLPSTPGHPNTVKVLPTTPGNPPPFYGTKKP